MANARHYGWHYIRTAKYWSWCVLRAWTSVYVQYPWRAKPRKQACKLGGGGEAEIATDARSTYDGWRADRKPTSRMTMMRERWQMIFSTSFFFRLLISSTRLVTWHKVVTSSPGRHWSQFTDCPNLNSFLQTPKTLKINKRAKLRFPNVFICYIRYIE